mgnify:CR=1 FL=1
MGNTNEMIVEFDAVGENEGFARVVVAAFVSRLNPTLEELSDLKVAVSEAVTNAIIHGYDPKIKHTAAADHDTVQIRVYIADHTVTVQVQDHGRGIPDISQAMEPLFTTKPEEDGILLHGGIYRPAAGRIRTRTGNVCHNGKNDGSAGWTGQLN